MTQVPFWFVHFFVTGSDKQEVTDYGKQSLKKRFGGDVCRVQ